ESQTGTALSLGRVKIQLLPDEQTDRSNDAHDFEVLLREARNMHVIEGGDALRALGYNLAYPLTREDQDLGLLLIEASPNALSPDVRAVLEVLAGQIVVA